METFIHDIRYGIRLLIKSPGFTCVAILTLALGIGANTVIFSVINSVLLRSLPFQNPDRLVTLTFDDPQLGLVDTPYSVPELDDLKSRTDIFEDVSVIWPISANLTGAERPQRMEVLVTSPNYFSMLGVKPEKGRLFGRQDFVLGFAEAIIISDGLWHRAFGGDPNIIGRHMRLDNDPYTIVGVLPPGFRHPGRTIATDVEVWATGEFSADPFPKPTRIQRVLRGAIGRLKPGVTLAVAQAKLDVMLEQLRKQFASDYDPGSNRTVRVHSLQESLVGNVRPILLVLMGAVILIILIASLNIANLLLARASGRQREVSMRLALGASRVRIIRQMLTESVFLSFVGGVVGVATAYILLHFIIRFVPFQIPRQGEIGIDWAVLAFAVVISFLTALLFGIGPAIQSATADLLTSLREGARGSGYSAKTHRLRGLLIISELAFTMVLMIGAGLLIRTLWSLLREDPGFNSNKLAVASMWLPTPNDPRLDHYGDLGHETAFARELLRRMLTIPGVEMAAITSDLPGAPPLDTTNLIIEGLPLESQTLTAEVISISPDYFRILRTPLVQGRFFSESDQDGTRLAAIIDETTVRRYWPNRDPIGRRFRFNPVASTPWSQDASTPWLTIVGVVKDIKHDGLGTNGIPHIYVSVYQQEGKAVSLVLRTPLAPSVLEPSITAEVHTIDPDLTVFAVQSMNEVMDRSLAPRRFSAELVGIFAALAVLLASVGVYGLLAYLVEQRSQEIGVRIALGAQRRDILKMILSQGALLTSLGVCAGLILAAISMPAIANLLYGIRTIDPDVFLAAPLILVMVSFAASYIPARRATNVRPIVALREG
jgi:putative ABC transport system permease protein